MHTTPINRQRGIGIFALLALLVLVGAIIYIVWRLIHEATAAAGRIGYIHSNEVATATERVPLNYLRMIEANAAQQMATAGVTDGAERHLYAIESATTPDGPWNYCQLFFGTPDEVQAYLLDTARHGTGSQGYYRANSEL